MFLAITVGNSSIALGSFHHGELTAVQRAPASPDNGPGEQLGGWLDRLSEAPETVLLAGVVPDLVTAWEAHVRQRWSVPVAVARRDFAVPLEVLYEPPEACGVDRLLAALAARERYGAPVLVADLGTATTLNVVGSNGAYLGGAILAGLGLMRDALATRTALLPTIDPVAPATIIGRSTNECLQVGLVAGHAAALAGLARQMRLELNAPDAPLIATGGWSQRVADAAPGLFTAVEPELVLYGLAICHEGVRT